MRTFRLESGARIGKTTFSIETVSVESTSRSLGDQPRKIATCFGSERDGKAVFNEDLDAATLGGPHPEPHSFSAALRSESQPPMACGWAQHYAFCLLTRLCRLDSRFEFAYLFGMPSRLDGLFQQDAKSLRSSLPSTFLGALSYLFLHANQKEGQDSRFLGLQLRE